MTIDQLQVTIAATFIPITQMMDRKNSYPDNIIFGKIWCPSPDPNFPTPESSSVVDTKILEATHQQNPKRQKS